MPASAGSSGRSSGASCSRSPGSRPARRSGPGIGALAHKGVDGKFVKEVKADLEPGKSALFMVTQEVNAGLLVAALRPYSGTVLQTSVDEEFEASLRNALKTKG